MPEAVSASVFRHSKLMRVLAVRSKFCSPTKGLNGCRSSHYVVVSTPF
jgi:hypothetical protein